MVPDDSPPVPAIMSPPVAQAPTIPITDGGVASGPGSSGSKKDSKKSAKTSEADKAGGSSRSSTKRGAAAGAMGTTAGNNSNYRMKSTRIKADPSKLRMIKTHEANLASSDATTVYRAAKTVRRLLSAPEEPPIQEVIEAGLLKVFVDLLANSRDPRVLLESAWVITNVASGMPSHTQAVIDAGAIPALQRHLKSDLGSVKEQCIWALSNIAGDRPANRDKLYEKGIFEETLDMMTRADLSSSAGLPFARKSTWFLSNLLKGKPRPSLERTAKALPLLNRLLRTQDSEVLADAGWATVYFVEGSQERIDLALSSGELAYILVDLLAHPSLRVQEPALLGLGILTTGYDLQVQVLLDHGLASAAHDVLSAFTLDTITSTPHEERVARGALWLASNVASGTSDHIRALIDAKWLPLLEAVVLASTKKNGSDMLLREALWALRNMSAYGAPEHVMQLAASGKLAAPLADLICARCKAPTPEDEELRCALIICENVLKTANALGSGDFQNALRKANKGLPKALQTLEATGVDEPQRGRARKVLEMLEVSAVATNKKSALQAGPKFLQSNKDRMKVELSEKIMLSHNSYLFRFKLPTPETILGLPVGKHIKIWGPCPKPTVPGQWNGQPDSEAESDEVERKYTPTSSDATDLGHFDLVVKIYRGGELDCFPDGGKMSQYLESKQVGDTIEMAGPFGLIEYFGKGKFNIRRKERQVSHVGMIAGGTGITPMLQIIAAILKDPQDKTRISLIYANTTYNDILLRDVLDELQVLHPDRFKVWYTLSVQPSPEELEEEEGRWKYDIGYVSEDMIRKHLEPPQKDGLCLLCGPPVMLKVGFLLLILFFLLFSTCTPHHTTPHQRPASHFQRFLATPTHPHTHTHNAQVMHEHLNAVGFDKASQVEY